MYFSSKLYTYAIVFKLYAKRHYLHNLTLVLYVLFYGEADALKTNWWHYQ